MVGFHLIIPRCFSHKAAVHIVKNWYHKIFAKPKDSLFIIYIGASQEPTSNAIPWKRDSQNTYAATGNQRRCCNKNGPDMWEGEQRKYHLIQSQFFIQNLTVFVCTWVGINLPRHLNFSAKTYAPSSSTQKSGKAKKHIQQSRIHFASVFLVGFYITIRFLCIPCQTLFHRVFVSMTSIRFHEPAMSIAIEATPLSNYITYRRSSAMKLRWIPFDEEITTCDSNVSICLVYRRSRAVVGSHCN